MALSQVLKIVYINVNSIVSNNKRYELLQFLEKNDPDICLLGETKLNDTHKLTFKNYEFIRNDRKNAIFGGGTGILVKRNINFEEIKINANDNNKILETTAISIKNLNSNKLYIVSMYATNSNHKKVVIDELNAVLNELNQQKRETHVILAGDFNARHSSWGDSVMNTRGALLFDWLNEKSIDFKLKFYPPEAPTYPRTQSYIDIALVDSRINICNAINNKLCTLDYDSDHKDIYMEIDLNQNLDLACPPLIQKINIYLKTQTGENLINN